MESVKNKVNDIMFYGERGVVNGIILDIKDDLEKVKIFLKSIRFVEGKLKWVDDLESVIWWGEPNFSEFGSPDLVLIAKTDKDKYVIFIEAKLICYDDAALLIKEEKLTNNVYKSNASFINIQLALKYRFLELYLAYRNINNFNGEIVEKEDVADRYFDKPRKMKKLVSMCNDLFENVAKDNFYFVALTNDSEEIKDSEIFINNLTLPPLGCQGDKTILKKFGLISYGILEKENIISKDNGYYGEAAKHMLNGMPADSGKNSFKAGNVVNIKTINMAKWKKNQINLAEQANTKLNAKIYDGSYSKVVNGKTIVKIFTEKGNDERVLIALRDDGIPAQISGKHGEVMYMIGVGKNMRLFRCYPITIKEELETIIPFAEKYVLDYEERVLQANREII